MMMNFLWCKGRNSRRDASLVTLLLLLIGVGAPPAAAAEADFRQELQQAIEQLKEEAATLEDPDSNVPQWDRPHPLVRNWSSDNAELVLSAMTDRFTDDERRDTYIRYHLLYVIQEHFLAALKEWEQTGTYEPSPRLVDRLESLTRTMPGLIELATRETRTYEPDEVYRQWEEIRQSTRTVVGFPPFQESLYGKAALPHVSGARKTQIEQAIKQMEELRPKWRRIVDESAQQYNQRLFKLNAMLRNYRAHVVYTLLQSGHQPLLAAVLKGVEAQISAENRSAFDLLDAIYRAAADGYLAMFEPRTLEGFGRDLERLARQHDQWKNYTRPGIDSNAASAFARNFGEYAFTLTQLLQQPYKLQWLANTVFQSTPASPDAPPVGEVTAEGLTTAQVAAAFQRAAAAVNSPPNNLADDMLPYSQPESRLQTSSEVPNSILDPVEVNDNWWVRSSHVERTGNHALAVWAQLVAGRHYLMPQVNRRLYWSLSRDTPYTWDRGMRLQMLAHVPTQEFLPWIKRDALSLYSSLSDKGNFPSRYTDGPSTDWGDHATGQYGVLGLWAATAAGVPPKQEAIERIDKHWRATRHHGSGGWALAPLNVGASNQTTGGDQPTGPMTAAGISTLSLTERYLRGEDFVTSGEAETSDELRRGLEWLNDNFSLQLAPTATSRSRGGDDDNEADPGDGQRDLDWYYYMWTMQRVSEATGYQSFNGVNLARDVTAEVLRRQRPSGLWQLDDSQINPLVSTGFAMLYLADVLQPMAISKVRHGGVWNNRPHDLWNFTDYASQSFESPLTWQIVDATDPVRSLAESPILYLSSGGEVELPDAALDNLRKYVNAGGMLIFNADGRDIDARRSLRTLAERLFPEAQSTDLPDGHPVTMMLESAKISTTMITNGLRPLILLPDRDLSQELQAGQTSSDAFAYLLNAYLYSVGRSTDRSRLDNDYLVLDESAARSLPAVKAVRVVLGGADPEPLAMPQLAAFLAEEHKLRLEVEQSVPTSVPHSAEVAFLTTKPGDTLSEQEAAALREWLQKGGTLVVDAAWGNAEANAARVAVLDALVGDEGDYRVPSFEPVLSGEGLGPTAHDNSKVVFNRFTILNRQGGTSPLLRAIDLDGRRAIYTSEEDLAATIAGSNQWGILGYDTRSARQIAANIVLSVAK